MDEEHFMSPFMSVFCFPYDPDNPHDLDLLLRHIAATMGIQAIIAT
jgi:hypothetical protein